MNIEYYCPKIHCRYNEFEMCTYDDEDFIKEILAKDDIDNCYVFEVKEGYCECGCELVEKSQRHPYGDTYATEYYMECPICD